MDISVFSQFTGLASVTLIKQLVDKCNLQEGWAKVTASIGFALAFNGGLALLFATPWKLAVGVALVTAFLSNVYHDSTKAPSVPVSEIA